MTITIRGITYQVDEGATITENYNETLDSATVRISQQTTKLNIEPFDRVVLTSLLGTRYFCIDTYVETMVSVNPAIYEYEISLFSETKLLEGIILPNLSITQLRTGTKRTIKYYLDQYLNLYGKKYRNGTTFVNKWSYNVGTKFDVECPEFQWNTPTLRAVITDLMMVVDCVPVLRNNVISYIDLTEKKNAVDTSKINYIRSSQSSSDYASEIKMTMQNVLQANTNNIVNTTKQPTQNPLVCESGYLITSDNFAYKTKYPINNIKHFYFGFWTKCVINSNSKWIYLEQDLCNIKANSETNYYNLVLENKEYITKDIAYKLTDVDTSKFQNVSQFQNFCLSFNRGKNVINNLNGTNKSWWLWEQTMVQTLVKLIVNNCTPQDLSIASIDDSSSAKNNYYRPLISIEYETLAPQVFQAGKTFEATNDRVIVDNQTNSWVDAFTQGLLEYQKVNRLGNKQLMINARYENSYNDIMKIGDYYDESIIYQCQYQEYNNCILINATACKDYILKDYFTGVKSKTRTWVNAQDEAFERHELIKYYCEFSKNKKVDYTNELTINSSYFLDMFTNSNPHPLISCNFKFKTSTFNNDSGYPVEFVNRIIGNSIVLTFGMADNTIEYFNNKINTSVNDVFEIDTAGIPKIPHISNDFTSDYQGIPSKGDSYVDNYFETTYINFKYHESNLTTKVENGHIIENTTLGQATLRTTLYRQFGASEKKSSLNYNYTFNILNYPIYKDNREIPSISTQFEFCSDTKDIVFTKNFIDLQRAVRNISVPMSYTYREEDFTSASGTTSVTGTVSTYDEEIEKYYLDGSISISIGELTNPLRFIRNISNITTSITSETGSISILRKEVVGNEYVIYYRLLADEWRTRVDADINYNYEVNTNPEGRTYRVYRGNVSDFNWRNPSLLDCELTDLEMTMTSYGKSVKLVIDTTESLTNKVFYICSENNILIAMKETKEIYLNILKDRDTNIYDSNGNIIGTILIS